MKRLVLSLVALVFLLGTGPSALAVSPDLVISQVYGGGGNSGATYTNDFIELFNRGGAAVDVTGWSVQYASAAGTTWQVTNLSGLIGPGKHYLVQEAVGAGGTTPLPTADATGTIPMSATSGKVALVTTSTALACGATCHADASVRDYVGYGTATDFEGSAAAPGLTNTTAGLRAANGCTDTDDNSADFSAGAPTPRNTSSTANACGGGISGTGAADPSVVAPGGTTLLAVTVTPGTSPASTGITVVGDLTAIGGSSTQSFFDDGTNGDEDSDDNVFSFEATVDSGTSTGAKSLPVDLADNEGRTGATTIALTVATPAAIHDIQGSAHRSPLAGNVVSGVGGIVTAKTTNGFWMQDPNPDANDATSEGIFVFTDSAPAVNVGDALSVLGTVSEFRPGGPTSTNLTTTELASPTVAVQSTGNPLPSATVVGTGGRVPPASVIEDDATGDVETSGVFDPASDGIDFYESLEGMRVQVNNPRAVGPRASFGEIPVTGDNGTNASVFTTRGGLILRPSDANPERIILDDALLSTPTVDVGDGFAGPAVGVMDYSFGNFKLLVTQALSAVSNGLPRETTPPAGAGELSVATFNVENLDPGDPAAKYDELAHLIVDNLGSPDLISVEEVQDNNGPTNDPVVDANVTLDALVAAIGAAGGPSYSYRQVNPVDDQDGGEPGGNIRQVFLFRTDRGLAFVDAPGGGPTTANSVVAGPHLQYSPGRIDPADAAFTSSRKPLAGEFTFNGSRLFVIGNHFNSKGGDQPLFGHFQPPALFSEAQRIQQAQIVNDFVDDILGLDANASVIVLGDLNDFDYSTPLATLQGTPSVLTNLYSTIPAAERYSYVFDGNSQALDHILASSATAAQVVAFDPVHVNAEFAQQASDHDPLVARFSVAAGCNGHSATIVGTAGNSTVTGTSGDDVIVDLSGSNTIYGKGGNDTICTGPGNDKISAGDGADWVDAGDGRNTVNGGTGSNTVATGSGGDSVTGGDGDDQITTGAGNDVVKAVGGNDTVDAGGGNNDVNTGMGDDGVTTGVGSDTISTAGGNDTVDAGDGTNKVNGGAGDDTLTAGSGNDTIDGAAGFDTCHPDGGTNTVRSCEVIS
ncbi:MAG TPA: lamin tail domain-containing protein [Gaiellaceae bacterium]|nr:lamin tail domain-containing protein [Gaiellaceae bacterium]